MTIHRVYKNKIGERNGMLVITGVTRREDNYYAHFICQCDCGNIKNIKANGFKQTHCGCNKPPQTKNVWLSIYNKFLRDVKHTKRTTDLTFEQYVELATGNCYLCDRPPSNKSTIKGFLISGIDRIDSSINYTYNNCKSCRFPCNHAKSATPLNDFLELCKKITEHYNKK